MVGTRNFLLLLLAFLFLSNFAVHSDAAIVSLDWKIQYANYTRLCHTEQLVTVNGQYPGPTVTVNEGDTVIIKVTNLVSSNVTIHWHGIRQLLSAWADGPAYITQCPIQTNHSFVHTFKVIDQRGTLFWHAHYRWLRATVYGAFIIRHRQHVPYPFTHPTREIVLLAGEWWNANPDDILTQAQNTLGGAAEVSNALTINGQPGDFYNCSREDTPNYEIEQGETVLLRLINAAVNFDVYFSVTNHTLTVVEADAEYTKQFQTDVVVIAAGQTTNVLLTANQSIGRYYMAFSVFNPANIPIPSTPASAILNYIGASPSSIMTLPVFPPFNDIQYEADFRNKLRSREQSTGFYYMDVPQTVDENLFYTVGYALQPCPEGLKCLNPFNASLSASFNNVTYQQPNISILQAYYNHINGVYETDFPDMPLFQYNYTGVDPFQYTATLTATKVQVLEFDSKVQLVLQDTATLGFESHPIHLHGQNFYIVGTGFGNFDAEVDTPNFNLVDPPSRNTVAVPSGGWAAIRFRANNPGVWFMHCHFDLHVEWGMATVFLTKDGPLPFQRLPPPPSDLPLC